MKLLQKAGVMKTFILVRFENETFGVKKHGGKMVTFGTMIEAGNYCIDVLGANADDVAEVLAIFKVEGDNYADFGIFGGWTFITRKDVKQPRKVA